MWFDIFDLIPSFVHVELRIYCGKLLIITGSFVQISW